jgi:omega-hydroxy-beta-dihydromenaquinone-9 sulfotransferase
MSKEKRASLPPQSPRIWHGMTADVWFSLLWHNRFAVSPTRLPMAAIISSVSVLNSALRAVSEMMYRKQAEAVTLKHPPLFVVGHWRTGTTWLHELLIQDERVSFPSTYQCMAPHHFLLTGRVLSGMVDRLMPSKRPMDDMLVGMSRPQEDEFALLNLGLKSPYLEWAFPNRHEYFDEYLTLESLSSVQLQKWKSELDWFIRRLTLHNPKRLVLKSPTHTARIRTLLDMYPTGRFVHIVRNPLDVIPSTIRTWTRMTDAMAFQHRLESISAGRILSVFKLMYDQFEKDRVLIPDSHLYELRYEDLVAAPIAELEKIYRHLDLDDFGPARSRMTEYLASISGFKKNEHQVSDELKAMILDTCQGYMDRYGYR